MVTKGPSGKHPSRYNSGNGGSIFRASLQSDRSFGRIKKDINDQRKCLKMEYIWHLKGCQYLIRMGIQHQGGCCYTLQKLNVAPEKRWLEDDPSLLGFGHFQGRNVKLREGIVFFSPEKIGLL